MNTAVMKTDRKLNTSSTAERKIRMITGPAEPHSQPVPIHEKSTELSVSDGASTPGQPSARAMTVVNGRNRVVVVNVATDRRPLSTIPDCGALVMKHHAASNEMIYITHV